MKTNLFQKFKLTDLGPTLYYFGMEVNISASKVVIILKTYVKKLLNLDQMNNCNPSITLMVKEFNLEPERLDFISDVANIIAYKKFIESVQWLVC